MLVDTSQRGLVVLIIALQQALDEVAQPLDAFVHFFAPAATGREKGKIPKEKCDGRTDGLLRKEKADKKGLLLRDFLKAPPSTSVRSTSAAEVEEAKWEYDAQP